MMKTLIGVGCSHTQASSFIKFPITGNGYELVTDALKEKYESIKINKNNNGIRKKVFKKYKS